MNEMPKRRGVFSGRVENIEVQPGLFFHNKDIVHKANFSTRRELSARLIIAIPLENKALMVYGSQHQFKTARFSKEDAVVATAVRYLTDDCIEGGAKSGMRNRSLVFSFTDLWLASHLSGSELAVFDAYFGAHMSRLDWRLPLHFGLLAETLNLTNSHSAKETMLREAFCLMIWEDFIHQIKQYPGQRRTHNQEFKSTRLKSYLQKESIESMTLSEIAQELSMSVSTLQRVARKEIGISLQRYLREKKLQKIKLKLDQNSISLQEASGMAGYKHLPNFITAFRKTFGHSPKHMK